MIWQSKLISIYNYFFFCVISILFTLLIVEAIKESPRSSNYLASVVKKYLNTCGGGISHANGSSSFYSFYICCQTQILIYIIIILVRSQVECLMLCLLESYLVHTSHNEIRVAHSTIIVNLDVHEMFDGTMILTF